VLQICCVRWRHGNQHLHFVRRTVFSILYFSGTIYPSIDSDSGRRFVFASAFGLGGGIILGTLSVFIGASLGAIASFLLGRYLLRDFVHRLTKKYTIFEALDVSLQQNGLKIFLLLRLSPIIPFNVINYIGGVSAVSFRDYVLATQAVTSCLGLSSS
jgi:membrane protein DedA with SNARE-associated domain